MKTLALAIFCLLCNLWMCGQGTQSGGATQAGGTTNTMAPGQITIASISVTPNIAGQSQNVGQTFGMSAIATLSNGATLDITAAAAWSTSNPGIANLVSLTATENAQCASAGTVTFTASYAGASGSDSWQCVGVLPPPPTPVSLALTPQSPSIPVGQTGGVQYTVTETYSDGSTLNVTAKAQFTSGTTSVATVGALTTTREVDCNGNSGTSLISAVNDSLTPATTTQTCTAVLSSITVGPATPSIVAGNTIQLQATCHYSDGSSQTCSSPTWSSGTPADATVNQSGLVTGVAAGTSTVSSAIGSISGNTVVTVTAPGPPPPTPSSVTVTPATQTINKNSTLQYGATLVFSDGSTQTCTSTATWVSTSTGVATITAAGLAMGVANGSTTIQATCSSILGSTTLTVQTPAPTLSSIAVTPATATQYNGSTVQFTATGTYSDGSTQNITSQAAWTSSATAVATIGASTGLATCVANSGSTTVQATVGAVNGSTSLTCQTATTNTGGNVYCTTSGTWIGPTTDGPSSMPTQCMYTAMAGTPSPGTVHGPDSLTSQVQADINAAACGDIIKVQAGSQIGSIVLPHKGCDNAHWITIETTGITDPSFPAEGVRMTPCWSGIATLSGRPTYGCTTPKVLTFKMVAPAASSDFTTTSADHYRIIGAELTRVTTPGVAIFSIVDLSSAGTQTSYIILDRSWFEGLEGTFPSTSQSTDTSTTRGVWLGQSNHIAIIDSYFSNFYDTGSRSANGQTDAQCVGGGAGSIANSNWGVYKFVNNHCEASGEGILLGGSGGPALTPPGCTITVNCNLDVPTDIEVRQNYFFKPLQWDGNTTVPGSTGWPVGKNGFEMKIGARALFEANVIENVWYNAQVGYCWSIAPKNQSGGSPLHGTAPTALTNDFTYRYNYCYNAAYGIGVYQSMDGGCSSCQAQGMNRISIHDNVIGDDLNLGNLTGQSAGDEMEIYAAKDSTGQGLNKLQNVNISHNTFVKGIRALTIFGADGTGQMLNFTIQNNIWSYANFGWGDIGNTGGCDTPFAFSNNAFGILQACVTTYTADHNAVFNWPTGTVLGKNWPTNGSGLGNFFFNGTAGVGFTNYGTGNSNLTVSNYKLTTASPLHNAGSDGKDIGADIVTLLSKVQNVPESGQIIALNWQPSTTAGVTYNAYRASTTGGPYNFLGNAGNSSWYFDQNVSHGNTYYYVMTSWDGTNESVPSNEVNVTLP